MVKTVEELYNGIEKDTIISKEITDTLLELDVLPSIGTQASLNDMLEIIYNRIKSGEQLKFECTNQYMNKESFIDWVQREFTEYSANMFSNIIK